MKKRLPLKTCEVLSGRKRSGRSLSSSTQSDPYQDTLYTAISQMDSPSGASNGSATGGGGHVVGVTGGGAHGSTTVPGEDGDDSPNGWNCSIHPSVFFLLGMQKLFGFSFYFFLFL